MRASVVVAISLASSALVFASCSLDTTGTAEETFDGAADAAVADLVLDVPVDVPPEACAPDAGSGCNSSLGCFSGTVQCDGTCNAPPDPLSAGSKCKTPKGCDGKLDCDGACQGEPLATGSACTTKNGCAGKQACDMSCVGDPINFGKACKTALGCDSTFNCVGCPELAAAGKACTTPLGCSATTACDGSCKDKPPVGEACTTPAGCPSTKGCDGTCKPGDPRVGTSCTSSGCTGTYNCAIACVLPTGAKTACTSATCGIATTRDCMGVCPDPKPGDPTKTCRTCTCTTGMLDVKQDQCGNCPTCAEAGCIPPMDAGSDAPTDAPSTPDAPSDLGGD